MALLNQLHFFATTAKGVEFVLARELANLGALEVTPSSGGVYFQGTLETCYRANLWLRTASRILLSLKNFPCSEPEELYHQIRHIRWEDHLSPSITFAVDAYTRDTPNLKNAQYASLKAKDAIADHLRDKFGWRPNVDKSHPHLRINVHIQEGQCTVSLDSSGDGLHKRGYRILESQAPLKESLAAALVLLSEADFSIPLVDPMCGSGTIPIEAALLGAGIAPGLLRKSFGFQTWLGYDHRLWLALVEEAQERKKDRLQAPIRGSDYSVAALKAATLNARRAGVNRLIHFDRSDILTLAPEERKGILLFNPPYGTRMGNRADLKRFYKTLGDVLKRRCKGWTIYIFTGDAQLAKSIGLHASKRIILYNGPLECRLLKYEMY
jgi:putative N6-adenine-specific DNA methylase